MLRYKKMKSTIATLIAAAMLLTCNTSAIYADEVSANGTKAQEGTEVVAAEETTSTADILKDGADEPSGRIEVNQGFSYHVDKDNLGESPNYLKNFVASKQTQFMYPVKAKNEEEAKEATKNWKLYYVKADKEGNDEGDPVITWEGSEFSYQKYYDKNSNTVSDNMMAYVHMDNNKGPVAGKYNVYLEDNGTKIAMLKDVDFFETKPLNILAVPVTAYYGQAQNPTGGGAPSVGSFPCGDNWNGVIDQVKTYLLDVYPLTDITIDEGNVFDASSSDYDMCTDDGQKKLWDDVSKLQVRDKETGKDKYDIILAFVMYRQDAAGTGQGYTFGRPTNIITLMDKDMLPTVAHEIAHCYGIGDEYDGGSYNYRTNNVPLGYASKGRDKVDSTTVTDTTKYTFDNVNKYSADNQDKYPWLSSEQFSKKLGDDVTVYDDKKKSDINLNGNGSVIDLDLHPFILSKKEFVHFAKTDKDVCPTISYMGSGYPGNEGYYFTTSVIWDHLFNEFIKKEKKGDTSSVEEYIEEEEDDDLDHYYDEEMRFGESRLVEVSGEIQYTGKTEDATVSGCVVDPMFSYKGDLEFVDYLDLDGDDKDIPVSDRFVFAALDKDGKVITSPVCKEKSIVEFSASNINTGVNVDPIPAGDTTTVDKRIQNFCEFEFQAEYPEGTKAFAIMNRNNYDENGTYKAEDKDTKKILWFKDVPPQEI
ncbi:MAG: hypothetical protein IJ857_09595, partial [Lachnospiraceae bacterium]|nr:hypothetical protein [Lachnospiraceae bacterium]